MATVTIRIPAATHQRLRHLAAQRRQPIGAVVDTAVARLEDEAFFDELDADFARLRADPEASAAYDADLAAWDVTLVDGLEDLPWDE